MITLTTDFGTGSPYVAAMKGVIFSIDPAATVVDITHAVPPQDIRAGAVVLEDTCRWFPAGTIHVAVIDPGVGTARRILCVDNGEQRFIGPDNGVLWPAAGELPQRKVYELTERRFWLPHVSRTFHGRDVMAPAAAHLSLGVDPGELGPPIDDWTGSQLPGAQQLPGRVEGEVLWIDAFGNLITNVTRETLQQSFGHLESVARHLSIRCGGQELRGLVSTYAAASPGTPVALLGSSGRLEVAVVDGSAASLLAVDRGERVTVWAEGPR